MKPLTINFYVEDNKLRCSEHNFLKDNDQIIKARFSFPEKWNKAMIQCIKSNSRKRKQPKYKTKGVVLSC